MAEIHNIISYNTVIDLLT